MNMWWLLSTIFLTDLIMGNGRNLKEKKVRKNLIKIQTQVQKVQGHYQYHHTEIGIGSVNWKATILLSMT